MSYTPPAYNAADFTDVGASAYTPPTYNAADFADTVAIDVTGAVGAITVTGLAGSAQIGINATGDIGVITVTGLVGSNTVAVDVTGAIGAITVTGLAGSAQIGINATGDLGVITVTGLAGSAQIGINATGDIGNITVTGLIPSLNIGATVTAEIGEIAVTGLAGNANIGISAVGNLGTITVTGLDALAPLIGLDHWQLNILLNSADVSSRITGQTSVKRIKNGAAIAEFTLIPAAGSVNLNSYVNKAVTITYQLYDRSGGVLASHLRYTGFVEEPSYDPITRNLHFICSDHYQERLEAMSESVVDTLIPANYSTWIYNDPNDNYDYATQRLKSTPYDLNIFNNGDFDLAAWNPGTADYEYDANTILGPPSVSPVGVKALLGRDVINKITITFTVTYERLWHREVSMSWTDPWCHGLTDDISWGTFLGNLHNLPGLETIKGAVHSDWAIKSLHIDWPARSNAALTTHPRGGLPTSISGWVNNETVYTDQKSGTTVGQREGAIAFEMVCFRRWTQSITERYTITVQNTASIAEFGEKTETIEYTISRQDATTPDFEQAYDNEALTPVTTWDDYTVPVGTALFNNSRPIETTYTNDHYPGVSGLVSIGEGGSHFVGVDYGVGLTRPDIDAALLSAIHTAKTRILETHRIDGCQFTCRLEDAAELTMSDTAGANVPELHYVGKVSALEDTIDIEASGNTPQAALNVTLSMYGLSGGSDTAITVPESPYVDPTVSFIYIELDTQFGQKSVINDVPEFGFNDADDPDWVGLTTNYLNNYGYPTYSTSATFDTRMMIEIPEVSTEHRDEIVYERTATYNIAIPACTTEVSA